MTAKHSHERSERLTAQPALHQKGPEIQTYGTLVLYPIGLGEEVRGRSVEALNQVLVDTMSLRDLYKKSHWQVTGPTFYQLHLLFDEHFKKQVELIDMVGERIQTLGGLALAVSAHVAEQTRVETPPRCREQVPVQISRLLDAHALIIEEAREATRIAQNGGDDSTVNLLTSYVLPENEKQVWFLSAHLVDTPLARAQKR